MLSGFTEVCWSTLSSRRVPLVRSARSLRNHLSRGCADQVDDAAPPANFRLDAVGRKRQGRLYSVGGPSQVEGSYANAAAIASEPSRMHTHRTVDKQITEDRILAWRSPPMAIADVHHTCHIISGQCTRKHKCTASPSPQFACPQRGRKRLSREATLHTELALEWPDLVQIGHCKVQWPPRTANERILTRFAQRRQYTPHS